MIDRASDPSIPVIRFSEIDSTNAEARRRADAGESGPLWLVSGVQTQGRGRRGRVWETGAGNLAATLLLTLQTTPAEAALISFVTALAVADLAAAYVPPSLVALKWPNDVLVAGAKVSGVLIESGRGPGRSLWLAVGVGVNLLTPPQFSERAATTFGAHLSSDHQTVPSAEAALNALSDRFQHWLSLWRSQGHAPILEAWSARAQGLMDPCVARLDGEEVQGVAEGLDPDGALRLRLPDGSIRRITAGDVFFSPRS